MPDVIGTLFHKDIPYGGVKGDKGNTGATPNISATASVDSSTGTPSVNVVKTGTAENPNFTFEFSNLKGEKGDPGSGSSVSWGEINGNIANQTDLSTELGKKYDENDTAETDIQDTDYVPFYDTSATGKRKSLWSNIKSVLKTYFDGLYMLLSHIGTEENNATASKAYAVGEHFIRDGAFCTAIAAITQGAAFTLNTNYVVGTIADAIKNDMLSGNVNSINFQKSYGANGGTAINIDTLNNPAGYIFKVNNGNAFSGTWPSKLDGNSCILAGYSVMVNNKPMYGIQLAFGVTNSERNYIAMRTNAYSASGKTWTAWKYIELTTT